jgi:ketosteroid isomerase-like protein
MSADPRQAIEDLVLNFFMCLDTSAFEALVDCMAPDGVWHRQGKVLRGRDMILAAMAERGPDVRTAHMVTNFQLMSVEESSATARFYLAGYRYDGSVTEGAPAPMEVPFSIGLYQCRCTRVGDQWKIGDLRATPRFRR